MPRLLSSGPGATTGVEIGNIAFFRLQIGATLMDSTPALALVVRYPPGSPENQIALAKVAVGISQETGEVERVASAALLMGDREGDKRRIEEAYQLFKNNPRTPSQQALTDSIAEGQKLVDIYWDFREWLMEGCPAKLTREIGLYTVMGMP